MLSGEIVAVRLVNSDSVCNETQSGTVRSCKRKTRTKLYGIIASHDVVRVAFYSELAQIGAHSLVIRDDFLAKVNL